MKNYILILLLIPALVYSQDSSVSRAFKKRFNSIKSLIKPNYPNYPLVVGYILKEEAAKGDPFAQHELGLRFLLGRGFSPDTSLAAHWIKKAAESNLSAAKFNYGILLLNEIGVAWNPFMAFNNFKYAAESGMPAAQYLLGIFYTDNLIVSSNMRTAYSWIKKSYKNGFEQAKETLDELEKMGFKFDDIDIENNNFKSNDLSIHSSSFFSPPKYDIDYLKFEEDSLTEDEEVKFINELLGKDSNKLKRYLGIKKNKTPDLKDTSAINLISYTAKKGSPEAILILGKTFETGLGKSKDTVKAIANYIHAYRLGSRKAYEYLLKISQVASVTRLLKKRIENNDPTAMYALAGLAALGLNNEITSEQALEFLKKASDENHEEATIETGLCYYNGNLVKADKEKALTYWQKAADRGNIEAEVRIIYTRILDKTKEHSKDIGRLKELGDQGSVLAQAVLGFCYERGMGVIMKKSKAVNYYRKAAQRGNVSAYYSLKKLFDDLRPSIDEFQIVE